MAVSTQFEEVITTHRRLWELSNQPSQRASSKTIDHIDDICRRFIAASPFAVVSSRGTDGTIDLSPKGDPPGFIMVLSDKLLAIPDRPGNHRLDTFENLIAHPDVGLLLMIPGHGDTLRISGKGKIVRDPFLQSQLAVNGKCPNLVLIVEVEKAQMHCQKCMVRANLWHPESWPDRSAVPSLAEAIAAHAKSSETADQVQAFIDDRAKDLY